jgi:parallel beta-helix repeat protein
MKSLLKTNQRLFLSAKGSWLPVIVFAAAIFFAGCKKGPTSPCNNGNFSTGKNKPIVVKRGGSIQAAVDAASPGSTILIEPGVYNGEITIKKSGIQLIGMNCTADEKVIIQNPGDEDCGIMVHKGGDGFVLKNVTVEGFTENGVYLEFIDNFLLSNITTIDCKEYGLYPVHCTNGLIEYCIATGSADTGIYVGQSENVAMQYNTAYGNVNGFEIENCSSVVAFKNHSYNNVSGILIVLLPGLIVKSSSNITVTDNKIENNNHVNFAEPGAGFEGFVPSGSGILLVGADKVTIEKNKISGNNFTGIATVSTVILGALGGLPPEAFADIEPNADDAKIVNNTLVNNGSAPPAGLPLPGVDLLWDGNGTNNCWKNNSYSSSYPSPLPQCN